jgi:hypothetical protein
MNEKEIEKEINENQLNATRLTPEYIDSVIVDECFWNPSGTTLTICVLLLRNGGTAIGKSECASLENFNAELGQKISRDRARQQVFELEGYALREKRYAAA